MGHSETVDKGVDVVEGEEAKPTGMFTKMKDKAYKRKMLYWIRIPIGYFAIGTLDAQGGATILDLQIITSTNKELSSFFFTAYNCGYFVGSLLGGILHGKINSNIAMAVVAFLTGAVTVASPYCSTFALMFITRCLTGIFLGIIICMLTADHMQMWSTEGPSLLQFNNLIYACGGVLGPLFTSPFLAEKEKKTKPHLNLSSLNESNAKNLTIDIEKEIISYLNVTQDLLFNSSDASNSTFNETATSNSTLPRTTNVRYAFLIGGIILVLTAIQFVTAFMLFRKQATFLATMSGQEKVTRKLPRSLYIFLAAILFGFSLAYTCIEVTFNMYIMTFMVEQYEEVSTHQAAYITTFYWASFAVARFFSVFTSKYFASVKLLYIHFSFIVVALTGFLVSALFSRINALTAFTCLVGVACSAMFPALTSWTEDEIMEVTGPISAVILASSSIGATAIPYVVGYLMEHQSNFWFCYVIMIALGLAISFFVFLLTFNRCYVNKNYGKLVEDNRKEQNNVVKDDHLETAS